MTSERLVVIADAGPVIALSIVGRLEVLGQLFGKVLVPEAVYGEVVVQGRGRPGALELAQASWVERVTVVPPPDALLAEELGPGEAEAIALGVRRSADVLLIDERKGRRIASRCWDGSPKITRKPKPGSRGCLIATSQVVASRSNVVASTSNVGYRPVPGSLASRTGQIDRADQSRTAGGYGEQNRTAAAGGHRDAGR